jgi:class 3 adenylate cyclase
MVDASDIIARARAALDRGDPFAAYDIASEDDGSGGPELAYIRVLTLARLGDWRTALARYDAEGLDRHRDVDSLALKARLLKDKAFDSRQADRNGILRDARDAYLAAFDRTGEDFAAINAASLSFMIGDKPQAGQLARALLERSTDQGPSTYWEQATRAEALAILARFDEATAALEAAVRLPDASVAARSSTFQQIRRLLATEEALASTIADAVLRPIRPRRVAHFCGSMFLAGDEAEKRLAASVRDALRAEDIGIAIGALACGADIVIAEQALALGAELHVVFPFDRDDFVEQSVVNGGDAWRERFERCAQAATATYLASRMRYVNDDAQFAFGSRTAMGMARLRAAQLNAETVQLAVCDEEAASGLAGTAADMATWRAAGGRTQRLPTLGVPRPKRTARGAQVASDRETRALRVLVFADYQGFSRLPEPAIPRFWQTIMAACAGTLSRHGEALLAANTWGDGLHLVFDRVERAAPALTDLQRTLSALDLAPLGVVGEGGMRIAAHFGSVYEMVDPVTGRANFYGSEVSRAARLEAVTPPGKVYISEPMAAAIEMACAEHFSSRYVGRIELPKSFGSERIYSLEPRQPA